MHETVLLMHETLHVRMLQDSYIYFVRERARGRES
jgi:hypothetical protein